MSENQQNAANIRYPAGANARIFDGPTLRAVRESMGVPLRRIAKNSGMSHGHMSKVERGESGRPVTPAILAAYQRATGVDLHQAAKAAIERSEGPTARRVRSWTPGELTEHRRAAYNAGMAALSIGGHLGEPFSRLLDATGRPLCPTPPEACDIEQLQDWAEVLTASDLRHGGALVSQSAKHLLRWAIAMLDTIAMDHDTARRLHAAVAALAARAAWAAFDTSAHEAARGLFRLALYTAGRADDPNLRAHILADAAAQHTTLGYHHDALQLIRIAEGDERIAPIVRMSLHGVRARTYAALGDANACRHQVDAVEQAYMNADPTAPGWLGATRRPGHLWSITGHALAALVRLTDDNDDDAITDARRRLTEAIDAHDPETHSRAHALCVARLAVLHLHTGNLEEGEHWGRMALRCAEHVRSARLDRALATIRAAAAIRATAAGQPEGTGLHDLVDTLNTAGIGKRP